MEMSTVMLSHSNIVHPTLVKETSEGEIIVATRDITGTTNSKEDLDQFEKDIANYAKQSKKLFIDVYTELEEESHSTYDRQRIIEEVHDASEKITAKLDSAKAKKQRNS
jgi:hypothetical protein